MNRRLLWVLVLASLWGQVWAQSQLSPQAQRQLRQEPRPALRTDALQPPPATRLTPAAAPEIIALGPRDCVAAGGVLEISGRGFGAAADGRGVAMGGHGVHVDLTVKNWSDTRILAQLPGSSRLQPGQWYYAGLERADHGQWLSNINRTITVCASAPPRATGPAVSGPAIPAPASQVPRPNRGAEPASRLVPPADPPPAPTAQPGPARMPSPAPQPQVEPDPAPQAQFEPSPDPAPSAPPAPFRPPSSGSLLDQALPPPPAQTGTAAADDVEPGELVLASPDMDAALAAARAAAPLGLQPMRRRRLEGLGFVVTTFRVPAGMTVAEALAALRAQLPEAWVDANHRFRPLAATEHPGRYGAGLIGWDAAQRACAKGVRLGMVDTGVDLAHPALAGQPIQISSVLPAGVSPAPLQHGTALAALLAGAPGSGFDGLVPEAPLYVAAVMRQGGPQGETTAEWVVAGLDWLARQRVALVNLSLGGPRNLLVEAAVNSLLSRNVAVLAAAGNGGADAPPSYPAAQPGVAAITAVDAARRLYREANQGEYLGFAAPGVEVWSAGPDGGRYLSGTSYAVPYAAAVMAALRGAHPQAGWSDLYTKAMDAAVDLGDPGWDPRFGYGLLRAVPNCGRQP